jgi:hypothetical protein
MHAGRVRRVTKRDGGVVLPVLPQAVDVGVVGKKMGYTLECINGIKKLKKFELNPKFVL